jgi:peptidoglycan-N-acetylglucosamine deacetylase
MRFVTIPQFYKLLYPKIKKSFPDAKGKLFLTFDDGPDPDVTPLILKILDDYQAKATFFCLGENVKKFHESYQHILKEKHAVGNHTFNHLNGFKTRNEYYFNNIEIAGRLIDSKLFRPPYGKMKLSQYRSIIKNFQVILWDVLSYDFDQSIDAYKCANIVIKNAKEGSIIVFHDNKTAKERVINTLPIVLEYYKNLGYSFELIPNANVLL